MEGIDPALVQQGLAALQEAYTQGGPLLLLGRALMLSTSLNLFQVKPIQALLPEKLRWDALTLLGKASTILGFSFVGGAIEAVAGGMSIPAAASTAVGVALVAAAKHRFLFAPVGKTQTALKVAASVPKPLSKAFGIIVPLDQAKVDALRKKAT
jgi:hypothetical protein